MVSLLGRDIKSKEIAVQVPFPTTHRTGLQANQVENAADGTGVQQAVKLNHQNSASSTTSLSTSERGCNQISPSSSSFSLPRTATSDVLMYFNVSVDRNVVAKTIMLLVYVWIRLTSISKCCSRFLPFFVLFVSVPVHLCHFNPKKKK